MERRPFASIVVYLVFALFPVIYMYMLVTELVEKVLLEKKDVGWTITQIILIPCLTLIAMSYGGIVWAVGVLYLVSYGLSELKGIDKYHA